MNSLTAVEDSTKTTKTLWTCVHISIILALLLNELVLFLMALVENLKQHVAKWSLQRSLNNQTLDCKAILDLFKNEMMSIKVFGICKESMISLENIEIGKWYEGVDALPVTRSSHHLVLLSSSRIGPKVTNDYLM